MQPVIGVPLCQSIIVRDYYRTTDKYNTSDILRSCHAASIVGSFAAVHVRIYKLPNPPTSNQVFFNHLTPSVKPFKCVFDVIHWKSVLVILTWTATGSNRIIHHGGQIAFS